MRKDQSAFEKKVEEKLDQISKTIENVKEEKAVLSSIKEKGKSKESDPFHQVCLVLYYFVVYYLFLNTTNIIV
jgi:effector-binding domain-containing protein